MCSYLLHSYSQIMQTNEFECTIAHVQETVRMITLTEIDVQLFHIPDNLFAWSSLVRFHAAPCCSTQLDRMRMTRKLAYIILLFLRSHRVERDFLGVYNFLVNGGGSTLEVVKSDCAVANQCCGGCLGNHNIPGIGKVIYHV